MVRALKDPKTEGHAQFERKTKLAARLPIDQLVGALNEHVRRQGWRACAVEGQGRGREGVAQQRACCRPGQLLPWLGRCAPCVSLPTVTLPLQAHQAVARQRCLQTSPGFPAPPMVLCLPLPACCPPLLRVQLAERRKGNAAYRAKDFKGAQHHYERAKAVVEFVQVLGGPGGLGGGLVGWGGQSIWTGDRRASGEASGEAGGQAGTCGTPPSPPPSLPSMPPPSHLSGPPTHPATSRDHPPTHPPPIHPPTHPPTRPPKPCPLPACPCPGPEPCRPDGGGGQQGGSVPQPGGSTHGAGGGLRLTDWWWGGGWKHGSIQCRRAVTDIIAPYARVAGAVEGASRSSLRSPKLAARHLSSSSSFLHCCPHRSTGQLWITAPRLLPSTRQTSKRCCGARARMQVRGGWFARPRAAAGALFLPSPLISRGARWGAYGVLVGCVARAGKTGMWMRRCMGVGPHTRPPPAPVQGGMSTRRQRLTWQRCENSTPGTSR